MTLIEPIWLVLLIPLVISLSVWRMRSRWLLVLRVLSLGLLILALCEAAILLPERSGTVVVLADRSASMPTGSEVLQKEAIDLLTASMAPDDRLAVVSFGQTAAVDKVPGAEKFAGFVSDVGGDASNLADGLETALSLIAPGAPGKVLILSDGRWTGRDPAGAAVRGATREVAFDYRLMQRPATSDLAVARVDAPATVNVGESFMITGWVQSPVPQEVRYELRRGQQRISAGNQKMEAGLNRLVFRDQASDAGTQGYTLHVESSHDDPVPENNTARILVGVDGPRPLLCVSESPASNLASLLRAGKLDVKTTAPAQCDWSLETLSKYAGVILENVAAEKIGATGMQTLAAWVRDTGSGLMVTGGKSAYGQGGYYGSPLEPVLPVSMELRNEHRKLALAVVVTMDRSGSMSMPVGGGRQKMDLADLGAAQVLDMLGPRDEFGCFAVDTEAHVIAGLALVTNKGSIRDKILRIQSEGGGIYIEDALEAAFQMIVRSKAGTRHILLFADASDSKKPGRYKEILEECRKNDITVTAVGMGTPADQDADLLRDVARRGNGQLYFSNNVEELPRLFAQDTIIIARSTFIDEPTPLQTLPGLTALTGRAFGRPPAVGGYNLCYARPGASVGAVTVDEYQAPLVAAWQAGVGRVLCYTGEADGKHTGEIARWKQVGDLFTSLGRWVAGPSAALPGGMLVDQEVQNGVQRLRLHLDPERKSQPFSGLPKATVLSALPGRKPQSVQAKLEWSDADTLSLEVPLKGTETSLATVEVPGQGPVALPPVCLPYSPEARPPEGDRGLATLERLGRASGGKERVELASIWKEMPKTPRLIPIAPYLLLAAIMILLLEILERRSNLLSLAVRRRLPARRAATVKAPEKAARPAKPKAARPAAKHVEASPESVEPPETKEPAASAPQEEGLLDALRRARERSRGRTDQP